MNPSRRVARCLALLIASGPAWLAAPALAAPPTDAEVRAKVNQFAAWGLGKKPEAVRAEIGPRLLDAFTISELTPRQLGVLGQYYVFDGNRLVEAFNAAEAAAIGDSPEAATAATVAAWLWMKQQRVPPTAEELLEVLDHPGFDAALAGGSAYQVFELAGIFMVYQPEDVVEPVLPRLIELGRQMPTDMNYEAALMGGQYAMAIRERATGEEIEAIEKRAAAGIEHAIAGLAEEEKYIEPALKELSRQIAFIGAPAPALDFAWTSEGFDAKTLADLKGNVVVLDFWATWCKPCTGAFPQVRDLVEHYKGYPVKVVGVTSVQGFHVGPDGKRTTLKDDPAAEMGMMGPYREQMNITWPIAFTEQPVFNPEYSVQGIPHLAFIAPDGTVRRNGLNPHALSTEEEHAIIDALLEEFGLPRPGHDEN